MPTQPSARVEAANGVYGHGLVFPDERMECHRVCLSFGSVATPCSVGEGQFDSPSEIKADDESDGSKSSDAWNSAGAVMGDLCESVERISSSRRSVIRGPFPQPLVQLKASSPELVSESKLCEIPSILSEQGLFLLANSALRDKAVFKTSDISAAQAHPHPPTLPAGQTVLPTVEGGDSEETGPLCTELHCRKLNCNCEVTVNSVASSSTPIPTPLAPHLAPSELERLDLRSLQNALTTEETSLFNDLMDNIIDFSIQDMLRDEMDPGHLPVEPTSESLDVINNTWEDVFQNPFDYMLNAMDSCPNCGRQISLSRMALHIVSRCVETRAADGGRRRLTKRDRDRNRVSPAKTTRTSARTHTTTAVAEKPPPVSTTPREPSPEVMEIPVQSSAVAAVVPGASTGSRIASISEKLLRSKRPWSEISEKTVSVKLKTEDENQPGTSQNSPSVG